MIQNLLKQWGRLSFFRVISNCRHSGFQKIIAGTVAWLYFPVSSVITCRRMKSSTSVSCPQVKFVCSGKDMLFILLIWMVFLLFAGEDVGLLLLNKWEKLKDFFFFSILWFHLHFNICPCFLTCWVSNIFLNLELHPTCRLRFVFITYPNMLIGANQKGLHLCKSWLGETLFGFICFFQARK